MDEATFLAEQRRRLLEDERRRRAAAAANVALQSRKPASEVARANALAEKYGVGTALVEANPEPFERRDRLDRAETALTVYPWMAKPLQDPDNAAMLSDGDIKTLGEMSRMLNMGLSFSNPVATLPGTPVKPTPKIKSRPWTIKDYATRTPVAIGEGVAGGFYNVAKGVWSGLELAADTVGLREETEDFFRRNTVEFERKAAIESTTIAGLVKAEDVQSGLTSLVQTLIPLPLGKGKALAILASTTATTAYSKYRNRGGGFWESVGGGTAEGAIEYITEKTPVGYLGDLFGAGMAGRFVKGYLVPEVVGEQVATLGQDAVDTAIANPNKTWGDYLNERPEAAISTLVATLTMGGLVKGSEVSLRRLGKVADDSRDSVSALAAQQSLDSFMEEAGKSELRTSSPEKFAEFVEEGAAGTPVKHVYLPIEAVDAVLADEQVPEEEKAVLSLYQDQIEEARLNNSEIVVPIGEAAARFAGTKMWESMREDARVLAGGISGREAREKLDGLLAEVEAIGNEVMEGAQELDPDIASKAAVYAEVKKQVLAAGRSDKEAKTTAILLASRAENLASGRYGKFKNAEEAWKWMQLRIVGADQKVAKGKAARLNQPAFANIPGLLERDDWAVLTAENPDAQQLSPEENATRLDELKQTLDAMGLSYTQVRGVYDNEENSLAIEGITEAQARALGARFGQDSVLTRRGLIYRDNTVNPARGVNILERDADNYFTELPDGTKFSVDIDFDTREAADAPQTLQQSALPANEVASSIQAALEIARSQKFANQRDFKLAVQKTVKKNRGNLRNRKRLMRLALNDAQAALQNNANAIGWYDVKVGQALEVLGLIHPEIISDVASRFAFTYALAVTSNGLRVDANFALADKVFRHWQEYGEMPENVGEGTAASAMSSHFMLFNILTKKFGFEGLSEIMTRRDITVKELETLLAVKVGGEHKGTKVTGAAFLGPKIGNGFFSNLNGNFDQLTMDRWFIRTWGRWTGTLVIEDKAKIKAKREKVEALLASLTAEQRTAVEKAIKHKIKNVDAFAKHVATVSAKEDVRNALHAIGPVVEYGKNGKPRTLGERIRLDAKALYAQLDGQKEAPQNAAERNEIRSIMVPVLERLREDNPSLTMADLQAVLWYPEKTLYAAATAGGETSTGYEDDEAPDYANAAVALAREEGISQEEIDEALKTAGERARHRAEDAERARGAGRAPDGDVPGFAETAEGFPAEDVLSSERDGTLDPVSYNQFGGEIGASGRLVSMLGKAQDLEESGFSREDIWSYTGWIRGEDGLWRFEFDDSQAKIKALPSPELLNEETATPGIDYSYGDPIMHDYELGAALRIGKKLEDVLDHPELFERYPALSSMGVFLDDSLPKGANGYFDGFNIVLNASLSKEQMFSTMMHEIQHAIQAIEGFTSGANPQDLEAIGLGPEVERTIAYFTAVRNGEVPGMEMDATDELLVASARWQVYSRVLGEVEARNTQKRINLSKARRLFTFPDGTADVPPERRIVVAPEPSAGYSVEQPGKAARGEATFYPDGRTIVQLFAKADFSTMLHELSHVFLQQEFLLAKEPGASAELKADIERLTKWFADNGVPVNAKGMPEVGAHELFARTGERYYREGKAPSAELRSAFKQFKDWLIGVYKSVKDLQAFGPAPINPEIRAVLDRMIATAEAIEANATTPMSQQDLGMSEEEYSAYLDSVNAARDDAHDILLERMMKAIRQRDSKRIKAQRANVKADVAKEVNSDPRFVALHLLRTGRWLGQPEREATRVKLNTGWLIDNFGEEVLQLLPVGLQPLHRGDGLVGDMIAEMVGMASGHELVEALLELKAQADQLKAEGNPRPLRDQIIEDKVDEIMAERHGDIAMSEADIEEEAMAALNANRQGEVLAAELRQLKKIKADPGVVTPYRLLREWARRKVNEGTVDEAVSKAALTRYTRAYNKARNLFEQALVKRDDKEAIKQKQAQMINHALLAEGKIVADEINAIVRRMERYARVKAMASIDQAYMDRIHELLEGYNFRQVSDAARQRKASFEAWAEEQRALGHEVYVPAQFRDDRTNWKDAKVTKLLELNDMVQSIAAQGKLKQKLTTARRERELAATVDDIESRILELPERAQPESSTGEENRPFKQSWREAKTFADYRRAIGNLFARPKAAMRAGAAELVKIEGLMDILDGTKDGTGPLNEHVVQGATEAANRFSALIEEVMEPIIARYKQMGKHADRLRDHVTINELTLNVSEHEADRERLGKPVTIPRMKLIGLLLNTGNLSNLSKLVGGERWGNPESATDMARVRDILVSHATKEDLDLVQDIWNGVAKLWPHIVEVERQLTGVVPEEVVPVEFETPHGPYSGGYWPVVWDSARSDMGRRQAEDAETSLQGVGFGIGTPKGHTITRTGAVAPMEWSVEHVLFGHLTKVVSRIAYAPWVRDTLKIVDNPRVTGAIRLRLGKEYVAAIKPWIRDQIPSSFVDIAGAKAWERWLDQFRINMSIAVLGVSYSTGLAQMLGLGYSAGVLGEGNVKDGGKWVARGIYEMLRLQKDGAVGAQEFVFARSEEMQRRVHEVNQESADVFRRLRDNDTVVRRLQAGAFWHIGFIDLNMVAIPTWLGGYHKAIAQGLDDAQASAAGDKAVRLSQSSGRKKDLSAIQRGGAAQKFISMFYTPSSVFFNSQWEGVQHIKAGNWSKALAPTFWFLVATTIADAMREGDWPEDDEDDGWLNDLPGWVGRNLLFGAFYGIPIARDVANTTERKIRGEYSEYGTTPLSALMTAVGRGGKSAAKAFDEEKDVEGKDIKNMVTAVGFMFGMPGSQIGKTGGFYYDVANGNVEPDSVYDWYHGTAYGKLPKDEGAEK